MKGIYIYSYIIFECPNFEGVRVDKDTDEVDDNAIQLVKY